MTQQPISEQAKILIVEDDPDGQEVVSYVLSYLNYECDVVNDAETAEQKLRADHDQYHAIIIDLALPGMSGWDLLNIIHSIPFKT